MKKIKIVIWWILLLSWMAFIFYMSNQVAEVSSAQSSSVIEILESLGMTFNDVTQNTITFIVRKTAHFSEYFILAILGYNVMKHYFRKEKVRVYVIAFVFAYACSDELHQYFVPGRSMAFRDVIIDTCGGAASSLICSVIDKVRNTN